MKIKKHSFSVHSKYGDLSRNKVCLFFLMANALFVTIVFSLQQVNSQEGGNLSIKLPCADNDYGEAVEPISISFTLVFGLLLVSNNKYIRKHSKNIFLTLHKSLNIK